MDDCCPICGSPDPTVSTYETGEEPNTVTHRTYACCGEPVEDD